MGKKNTRFARLHADRGAAVDLLLSALAVGLLYMVSDEQRMGGNDLEGNLAFYGAESGIENLTAQLSQLYQSSQTPDAAAIKLWPARPTIRPLLPVRTSPT